MRKSFTLLFLMGFFGLFTTGLFAQQDATIDPADIRYWIGEGDNEVVFIVNWAEPDTALAWGYRFAGESVTLKDVMDGIAEVDTRFSYDATGSDYGYWLNDLFFNDGVLDLSLVEQMWASYLVNGNPSMNTFDAQTLVDGDYVKWGDTHCGTMVDPENWVYVWEKEVAAVYPLAYEAMIDFSEIVYWIGEGQNEVVFCVNWNNPNKALAWGYRFDGESKILKEVMDDIANADPRFAYESANSFVTNLTYNDGNLNLGLYGMYFMYNVNGMAAWYAFDEQVIVDGDFIKWGDESCGTEIAQWTLVWEQPVEPVSVYDALGESSFSSLSVYPNPAVSEAFVTVENTGLNTVSVFDVQGRMVSTMSVEAQAGEQLRLDVETLKSGVYFVRVASESATRNAKLVVK